MEKRTPVIWLAAPPKKVRVEIVEWGFSLGYKIEGMDCFTPHYRLKVDENLTYAMLKWPKYVNWMTTSYES